MKTSIITLIVLTILVSLSAQDIVSLEYFVDNDPGHGSGNVVSVGPGEQIDESFTVDISGVSDGFHNLYVRVLDEDGIWSLAYARPFYKAPAGAGMNIPDIVSMEYFIDSDPGHGNGNLVSVGPGEQIDESFVVDISSVSEGFHNLYVRVLDEEGNWGLVHARPFYKAPAGAGMSTPDIVSLEYFIDSDPGHGNGNLVSVGPGEQIDESFTVDISGASEGFHNLYVRVLDEEGNWSLVHARPFYKAPAGAGMNISKIVSMEYFIDSDPGHGNGNLVNAGPGAQIDESFVVDISSVSEGFHNLYVRVLDEEGNWSLAYARPFYKMLLETFLTPEIVELEYFINSDPGHGQGMQVPVTAGASIDETFVIDVSALDTGVHVCYVRCRDDKGQWSLLGYQLFEKRHCDDGVRNGDEEWVDCGGICGPCTDCNTDNVHISDIPIEDRTWVRASQFITSTGLVAPTTEVILQAANFVELQTEFEVQAGAEFEVRIDDCDDE